MHNYVAIRACITTSEISFFDYVFEIFSFLIMSLKNFHFLIMSLKICPFLIMYLKLELQIEFALMQLAFGPETLISKSETATWGPKMLISEPKAAFFGSRWLCCVTQDSFQYLDLGSLLQSRYWMCPRVARVGPYEGFSHSLVVAL